MSTATDDVSVRSLRAYLTEGTAATEARLAGLLAAIREHRQDMAERFHELGAALLEIKRAKLYAVRDGGSLAALLHAEGIGSPRHARKLMKVAERMTRAQALSLGLERAYALLTHVEHAGGRAGLAAWLSGRRTIGGVPVARASRRAIEAATRALRHAREGERAPSEAARVAARSNEVTARRVGSALRAAGCPRGGVKATARRVVVTLDRAAVDAWLDAR